MLFIKIDRHSHTMDAVENMLGFCILAKDTLACRLEPPWIATVFWTKNAKLRWVKVMSAKALALFYNSSISSHLSTLQQ